ncbi:hypothetical protein ZWY2020_054563 [Hordeum vulgare]|nr:hypothetical protein ZWY2020_054563 [Hordeum vulgare]
MSAVFLCEDEGSHATSSGSYRDAERTRVAPELTRGEEAAKKHHHLDLNTLRGHTDSITVLDFSSDACNLATGDPLLKVLTYYNCCFGLLEETPFVQPSKMTYP